MKLRLRFESGSDLERFAVSLFRFISRRADWSSATDYHQRKQVLYVTVRHQCVENYIMSCRTSYRFTAEQHQ